MVAWLRGAGEKLKTPQPNIEVEAALHHIAHYATSDGWTSVKTAFEDAAGSGNLVVWGQVISGTHHSVSYCKLTAEHWRHVDLDMTTFADAAASDAETRRDYDGKTMQRTTSSNEDSWANFAYLRVNKANVLQLWPSTKSGSPLES